ncbi:MAG: Asp-tRNA(Asn)/Glu-tRNA(Gln) amidotransferase subunit GatC [Elusimicrobiota bacterium]
MKITKEDVDHVARLGRLNLTPAEKEKMGNQIEQILEYMDNLNKLDTSKVAPTSHVMDVANVWREDKVEDKGNEAQAVLSIAPDREGDFFKVKKVIEG